MTNEPIDLSRRRCLQSIGGVLTLTALGSGFSVTGCKRDGPPAATTTSNPATEGPFDVNFRLTSKRELVRIKAPESALDVATDTSHTTEVWRYVGAPFSGSADALLSMERGDVDPAGLLRPSQGMGELTETAHPSNEGVERGYLGPLIILRRGQRVRAELQNNLDEETNVHWHGLHIPPETDGQPRNPVKPGKSRAVAFDVTDRAGLYWYHPLPHGRRGGRAGFQTYMGMAGPLVIRDETEDALDLPAGEQELLMVLQDRRFDGERLEYMPHGTRETLTRLRGVHGDELLVNGLPNRERPVSTRAHRLRLLNASNARIYKLAFSDDRPVIVIGTDGGLLTEPVAYPFVTLAAGQRLDVWVDFTANEVDDTVDLVSEAFTPDNMADGLLQRLIEGRMIEPVTRRPELNENDATLDDLRRGGERLRVMRFQVTDKVEVNEPLPERLAPDDGLPGPDDMADPALPRIFHLRMRVMRGFTIEGGQINDPRLDAREIEEELQVNGANLDDKEVFEQGTVDMLEFHNETPFPHPIHLHGQQFAVTLRQGSDRNHDLWRGLVDVGRHDTVLVLPGENVRIVLAFEDYPGVSMYHCQNLEHFDGGMARYYQVKAPSKDQGSNGKA